MKAVEELLKEMSEDGRDTLMLIHELSSFVAYYRRLLDKLELDTLTGLPGSNKYQDLKVGIEKRMPTVGVIVFDVNDLKYYNDVKGHQAGDRLLQKAAESFHAVTGPNVHIFRTGGDEFVGIINAGTQSAIDIVITKWQEKLAELNSVDDGIRCNIAHGAAFGAGEYQFSDIMALADERMYSQKRWMKENGLKMGDIR